MREVPWAKNLGYPCIQEILVLRKSYVLRPPHLVSRAEILQFKYPRVSAANGEKMRNASGRQDENERQGKKVNRTTYNISSIKRVTRKFLEVSRCSRAKHRQRNVQKKGAARAKLVFCQLDLPIFLAVLVAVAD